MKSIFFLVSLVVCGGCSQNTYKKSGLEGNSMPNVSILLSDNNSYLNMKNIPEGQPVIIFYFSPDCPYCRAQMSEMTEHIDQLKKARIYVMTYAGYKDFRRFYDHFKVDKYPSITAGMDYTDSLFYYYNIKTKGVPFTVVYNAENKLSKAFAGKTSIQKIKESL